MTEHDHLDDEAISAVLDGEATADEVAHVDSCADCAARLAQLRDAALVVRTPVPPPTEAERSAAIAAALTPTVAAVTPLRRRTMPRWLPAAAAALVVLAGIGIVASLRGGSGDDRSTAASGGRNDATSLAAPETSPFAAAVFDGGDLGDIDVRTLRTTIESALSPSRSSGAQASGGAGATAKDSAATTTTPATATCVDAVRSGNPALGPLLYRATGHLDGQRVAVLAFDAGGRRWVYVVAVGDCAIRNQTTYSA